ncbi:hypothetical protein GGF31_008873 [Allomyces arbusculus]|nr:hypothetical protein GGF31_008873 [Allomyces arbusculus]
MRLLRSSPSTESLSISAASSTLKRFVTKAPSAISRRLSWHSSPSQRTVSAKATVPTAAPGQSAMPPASHPVWQQGRLQHVAIAVADLDQSIHFYTIILKAKEQTEKQLDPTLDVTTITLTLGSSPILLMAPNSPKSPLAKFLDRNKKGGIHHVCIAVADLASALAALAEQGIYALDMKPAVGMNGRQAVFLNPKDCGDVLIQLEERPAPVETIAEEVEEPEQL